MESVIPIQNLYYLLCYSWNRLAEAEVVDVSGVDSTHQADLFATVLIRGTQHLLRRGPDRNYKAHNETIPGIRGRVDIATSAQQALLPQGLAHCEFDELTANTLPNQVLRSTLKHLAKIEELDTQLKKQLLVLYRELAGIDAPPLRKQLFRRIQLHSNARFYRFILNICELVADSLLVDQQSGRYRFRDFLRDEQRMARVYEEFLFNFYRQERADLSIKKEKINWVAESTQPSDLAYLPSMETDISIRNQNTTLIIDAKYYQETLSRYHSTERVRSGNLYQLFAYLKNIEIKDGANRAIEGMLLYPASKQIVRLSYTIHGHKVRICTVNLAAHWSEIRDELIELVQDY